MADLPLSVHLLFGVGLFLDFLEDKQLSSLALATIFIASCGLIKQEGNVVVVLFVFSILVSGLPRIGFLRIRDSGKYALITGISSMLFSATWFFIIATSGTKASSGFSLSVFDPLIIFDILRGFAFTARQSQLLYLFLFVALITIFKAKERKVVLFTFFYPLSYLVTMVGVYFFTLYAPGPYVHFYQSYPRIILHVTPIMMVYVAHVLSQKNRVAEP